MPKDAEAMLRGVQARERALAANKENTVPPTEGGLVEACCHGADASLAPALDAAADALATPVQAEARAAPPQPPRAAEPATEPNSVAADPMVTDLSPSPRTAQPARAPESPLPAEPAGGSEAGMSSTTDDRSPSCASAPLQARLVCLCIIRALCLLWANDLHAVLLEAAGAGRLGEP